MTFAKWTTRYGGIFLLDQSLGVATSLTGFFAPNIYLYFLHSFEASMEGLVAMGASLAWLAVSVKQRRPWMFYVMPAYHLAGMVLMQMRVSTVADRLSARGLFLTVPGPQAAANFAALQDFDVTWLSLLHSSIGVVVGIVTIMAMRARLKADSASHHEGTKEEHEGHEPVLPRAAKTLTP